MTFLVRVGQAAAALIIGIDIVLTAIVLGLLYPFGLSEKPNGRQTWSGYVGRCAESGARWALVWERVINTLLWWDDDHCRRVWRRENR